ncbi:MAG TPA: type IX secretion system membrane protein PorP/SprF [Cyclobacteriaceae bacterium]|nr:type IX secretion system membrane protein PorP/SprF [Cyclobacteriaceae bacterium]
MINTRPIVLLFLTSLIAVTVNAQRDPLYAQYANNPFVLNPAYAGLSNNLNVALSYRNQWNGLEGSPKTINVNGRMPLIYDKMGAGVMVVSDRMGASTVTEALAIYSYQIHMTSTTVLSFGLQAGVANFHIDNSKVSPYDNTDPLFQGTYNEAKPGLGFGAVLKGDRFLVGVSVPRMLKSGFSAQGAQYSLYTQHYYLSGSYDFSLTEHLRFKPSTLLKWVKGAPLSMDLNASLLIKNNYQVGLLTRNFSTFGLLTQALIKDMFVVGYVFELPTGPAADVNFSTHEIMMGLRLSVLKFHERSVGL